MSQLLDALLNGTDNPTHKGIVLWLWRLVLAGVVGTLLVFVILSFSDLPSVRELENPKTEEASLVVASDNSVLGKFYTANRVPVKYADLSPYLVTALISTEDERYYEHCGIDFKGVARALFYLGKKGGASTITQQLAKQLFTGTASDNIFERVIQKLKEWIIAVRLERRYTKEEIIALYLNRYDFINGAQGIQAASEIYFNKPPKNLTVDEAATLVGMLQNASYYNPLRFAERTQKRREVVMKQMQKQGHLSQVEYDTLRQKPLNINFTRQTHIDGLAPYFRMVLAEQIKEILSRPETRKSDGTAYDIYRDGLRIYTTIDPVMQRIAEEQMLLNMQRVQKQFWRTWKDRDPWTYDTRTETSIPVEIRLQHLERSMRESDRYQPLRELYLARVLDKITEETDLTFSVDLHEVDYLLRAQEDRDYISKLVSQEWISGGLAAKYRRALQSGLVKELAAQWKQLEAAKKKEFDKPVKMRIFTYDNAKMEKDSTMSPLDSIRYHRMFLQTGIMAMQPSTGFVRAWVGGINHKWFQYDHVNVNTRRQVGSTFKPFVYAATIDLRGFTPCYQVLDMQTTIEPGDGSFHLQKAWTPRNSTGGYSGRLYSLRDGLRNSVNTVSAHLMKELGSVQPVLTLVSNMGIDKSRVPPVPSIALGSVDLSVQEMTGAYTTFANNGVYNRPVYLLRIEDRYGQTIYQNLPDERPALSPQANFVMTDMLQYAASGRRGLGAVKGQVGGKTGTTNDYADGWFMGITPELVVGTWVGGEDRWISFRSISEGQGANMAMPFFVEYIKALQASKNVDWDYDNKFDRPKGDLGIIMNCDEYRRPFDTEGSEEDTNFQKDPFDNEPDFGG